MKNRYIFLILLGLAILGVLQSLKPKTESIDGGDAVVAQAQVEIAAAFPTAAPPTIEPTATQAPTATLPAEFIDVNEEFASIHVAADELEFLTFEEVSVVKIVGGVSQTSLMTTYVIDNKTCNDLTIQDGIALYYLLSKIYNADWHVVGAMVSGESSFGFYVPDGNGGCKIKQNYGGAPAYCASQIWKPAGWGGEAYHKENGKPAFYLYPPADDPTSRLSLQDPVYCAIAGMIDYAINKGNRGIISAANYKGFQSADDPAFVKNFFPFYNAGGIGVKINGENVFFPFTDNARLEALLGESLTKMWNSIDDFYKRYGNQLTPRWGAANWPPP